MIHSVKGKARPGHLGNERTNGRMSFHSSLFGVNGPFKFGQDLSMSAPQSNIKSKDLSDRIPYSSTFSLEIQIQPK